MKNSLLKHIALLAGLGLMGFTSNAQNLLTGNDWPEYSWELRRGTWSEDSMTELTMLVSFPVQGHTQTIRLTTLASDAQTSP